MDLQTQNKNNNSRRKPTVDATMYGKVPPQARELELSVLGAILQFKEAYDEISENLIPEAFYVEANQIIFRSIQRLVSKNQPVDNLTVMHDLTGTEELETIGGVSYLVGLSKNIRSYTNINAHSKIIVQQFIKRELIRIGGEIVTDAFDDTIDCFVQQGEAERKILEVGTTHVSGGMLSITTVLKNAIEKIESWRQNETTLTGVPTGFPELDRATRGWQPGDLIIIAARPSIGKTALALNIIRNAAMSDKKKVTVAVWSLEMKAVYLVLRMLAAESEIILHRIQTGRLDDAQMKELTSKGVNVLSKANIYFDESSNVNIRSLSAKARRLKKKNNLGLIVIDYIQLMSGDEKAGNREQEISKISRALKNLAQELEVPIIALSQLSRDGEKYVSWDKAPALSSLRESGAIEQDADVVMMLWGPNDQEVKEKPELDGRRKIKIVKQRNGVVITTQLDFKNEIQLFKEIEIKSGLKPVAQANAEQAQLYYQNNNHDEAADDLPF